MISISLTQLDVEGSSAKLWKIIIPNLYRPVNLSFKEVDNALTAMLYDSWDRSGKNYPIEIVDDEDGIHVTFVAGVYNPQELVRVIEWLKNPQTLAS